MHNVNFNKKQFQHEANHGGVCYAFQNHMRPDPDCAGTLGKPSCQSDRRRSPQSDSVQPQSIGTSSLQSSSESVHDVVKPAEHPSGSVGSAPRVSFSQALFMEPTVRDCTSFFELCDLVHMRRLFLGPGYVRSSSLGSCQCCFYYPSLLLHGLGFAIAKLSGGTASGHSGPAGFW